MEKYHTLIKVICITFSAFFYSTQIYSQDTLQDVIIQGTLEVDTMLNLDYIKDTSLNYNRKIGIDKDGYVIVIDDSPQYNYQVNTISDVLNLNVPDKANIIIKNTGAKYCVQTDSIIGVDVDSCVVIKTNNNNYAVLQTRDGGYYIEDFGAIANDGNDDQPAIQKAIDAVLTYTNWSKTTKINAGAGIFDLKKGVVFARKSGNEYEPTTFTLSGNVSCYSNDQNIGKTTVFNLDSATFCIAVQEVRNCVIENIVFKGGAEYTTEIKNIIEWDDDDWGVNAGARTNRYSPSCAIVIDPFDNVLSGTNQYPYFSDYYTNSSTGGSSMLTIRNSAFNSHYIAIANNPSSAIQNGDNIRAENCHVKLCHTFWASGQTQSRSNSIENIYGLYLHTFINGLSIGDQLGTPPTVSNVNLAGGIKQLLNLSTTFSPTRISNSYFESIWSLGYAYTNSVVFDKCHIKFKLPSTEIFAPPYQLYAKHIAIFRDCSIEYSNGCNTRMPIIFKSQQLLISGGFIEGGVIGSNGYTNNDPGGDINSIKYDNVYISCLGNVPNKIAGARFMNIPTDNVDGRRLVGGDKVGTAYKTEFKNNDGTYNIRYLESITSIDIDSVSKTASFVTNINSGQYQIGDNLFTNKFIYPDSINMSGGILKPFLGFVSDIDGDTITVTGIPYGLDITSSTSLYVVSYPIFIPPIWGDFTVGNDTIKNVIAKGASSYPVVGMKLQNDEISAGAYVTAINTSSNYIVMSAPASSTKNFSMFWNAPYEQTAYRKSGAPTPSSPTAPDDYFYRKGCIVHLDEPSASYYVYVVTTGGVLGSPKPPVFTARTY